VPGSDLGWVTARTGASIVAPPGVASLALRRNPRRAHLLVSSLLGKHIPVAARDVLGAADALGALVAAVLTQRPMVVGFAETATALGHGVARALSARGLITTYAHTTRRVLPAGLAALRFDEEHSHAVGQLLAVADPALIEGPQTPVVLVDDELSTGRTAVNAIRVLQQRWPRRSYVLASLLDVRSTEQRLWTAAQVRDLGADLVDVSLFQGEVQLPTDLLVRAADLVSSRPAPPAVRRRPPAALREWELTLPSSTPLTGAHGWDVGAEAGLQAAVELAAATLRPLLEGARLCLGDEEFMYTAQLLAAELGGDVATSATTRSPVLVVDEPGYPVRTALRFPACEDSLRVAFAYNVTASSNRDRGPAPGFDAIVLVLDRPPAPHARAGLIAQLAEAADVGLDVVVVRAGPEAHPGFRRGGGR
jgi:adenine/guanine phosphoribosyltransferase-like PRPP-binding protein